MATATPAPAQQDTANQTPTPSVVGQAFAAQYYTILHQSPALVHRFYQDISKFGRIDHDGSMSMTTRMADINEKILSYGTLKAEIKSVDAQESYNGGVVLLITGTMTKEDESKQNFIQTFFLAPQDKGYFVLNDIFRYVDDDNEKNMNEGLPNGEAAPDAPGEDLPPVQHPGNVDQPEEVTEGEVYDPSEDGEGSVVEQEEPVTEVVQEIPKKVETVVESEPKAEGGPKKSYASIVKVMRENAAPVATPSPIKSVPKTVAAPVNSTAPPSVTENPNSNLNLAEDGIDQEGEGDGRSIYVRNLPLNANAATVKDAFKTFGPIKNGGIQVRQNKGFCFGFVEFEEPTSAQNAIEASFITIAGQQVGIEEKSTSSRVTGLLITKWVTIYNSTHILPRSKRERSVSLERNAKNRVEERALLNPSTICSLAGTCSTARLPLRTRSRTKKKSTSTCFIRLWSTGFLLRKPSDLQDTDRTQW